MGFYSVDHRLSVARILACLNHQQYMNKRWTPNEISRRDFVTLSLAASFGAATRSASSNDLTVVENAVDVKTPDGTCDAFFFHPAKDRHPGVLVWHDSPGLRPVIRELGKRMAAEGYSVLVPNLFYRTSRKIGRASCRERV